MNVNLTNHQRLIFESKKKINLQEFSSLGVSKKNKGAWLIGLMVYK